MDLASIAARKLAGRSSRRQFFKLLGAGSLGTGLFLTRTGVSLGAVTGCVGCGGGPCNPCFSPATICENVPGNWPCKTCQEGGGCPDGCSTGGEWFCCLTSGSRIGCRFRCSECNCPSGCANPSCHCFTNLSTVCGHRPAKGSGDTPDCTCPALDAPLPSLAPYTRS